MEVNKSKSIMSEKSRNKDNGEIEIYRIFEYYDYMVIEPKSGFYNYCIFFFSGFNENAGKYLYLYKYFFENFSKTYNINFKIYLPMLDIYSRDEYPNSYMVNYDDERQKKLYSWFNYVYKDDKRIEFLTQDYRDKVIKQLIDKEKQILGDTEKFIFLGFSMGGRYVVHLLEKYYLKTKFNILFKAPLFMFKSRKTEAQFNLEDQKKMEKYFQNEFFLIYSKNDKFCVTQDGVKSYFILKNEYKSVNLKVDNGFKHIIDYNCLELLKVTLVNKLNLDNKIKF